MAHVITAENLGKKYLLSHQGSKDSYVALRDVLADGVRSLGRRLLCRDGGRGHGAGPEEFWALRDLCFEVKPGERIGIIGRNGAGKSTLLKILSRITEPSTGTVRIKGRVASLLEVGTGFHPELTGRENIYLNGAILGMGRTEIKKKFDEIVAFAEVERFLDTPVKRYSSGMYVRLAFAVAAHLEPEILIVDEVLAVGDAQFQKKCLGRMEEVGKEGRTVLFVSHNLEAMKFLCTTGILLDSGSSLCAGSIERVIERYESLISDRMNLHAGASNTLFANSELKTDVFDIEDATLFDRDNQPITQVRTFESLKIKVRFHAPELSKSKAPILVIFNLAGNVLLRFGMHPYTACTMECLKGRNEVICTIEKLPLPAGTYLIEFGVVDMYTGEWSLSRDLCLFEVGGADIHNCGSPPLDSHAAIATNYCWETVTQPNQ